MSESNGKVVHKGYATTREFPVELAEGMPATVFVIKTMKNRAKTEWQNSMGDKLKYDRNGKPVGLAKYDGVEASLITRCMFHPDGRAVTAEEIDEWPAPLVTAAFKECQDVNGLTPESEDAAKK